MKSLPQISKETGIHINVLHYRTKAHGILPEVIKNIRYFNEYQIELLMTPPEKPDRSSKKTFIKDGFLIVNSRINYR